MSSENENLCHEYKGRKDKIKYIDELPEISLN